MAQTKIVIVAPSDAKQDELIDIEVSIYNITTSPEPHNIDWASPVVKANGKTIYTGDERTIAYWEPDNVETWHFQYTMPAESVTLVAESWFESYYYDWRMDTSTSKHIGPGGFPWIPVLAGSAIIATMAMAARRKSR